jgi:ketosteroid isomerase-like protein
LVVVGPAHPTVARTQGRDAHKAHEAADVRRTIEALFAAAERNDLTALNTLYASDSLLVSEGAGINQGWVDYRDHHLAPELAEFRNFKYAAHRVLLE